MSFQRFLERRHFNLVNSILIFCLLFSLAEFLIRFFGFSFNLSRLYADWDWLLSQPWALVSSFFTFTSFWDFIFSCLLFYWTAGLFAEFVGVSKLKNLVLSVTFFIVLLMLIFGVFSNGLYVYPNHIYVLTLLAATGTLLPDYQVRYFMFTLSLKWGAVIMISLLLLPDFNNKIMCSVQMCGTLWGFLFVRYMRSDFYFLNISTKRKIKLSKTVFFSEKISKEVEINLILDKISSKGYESLSERDKKRLDELSK